MPNHIPKDEKQQAATVHSREPYECLWWSATGGFAVTRYKYVTIKQTSSIPSPKEQGIDRRVIVFIILFPYVF
jgi:hypothetical protein